VVGFVYLMVESGIIGVVFKNRLGSYIGDYLTPIYCSQSICWQRECC